MKDLKSTLLRYHQREQLQNEVTQAEEMLKHAKPDEKGVIASGIQRTKRQLQTQSPEPLTAKEKDTLNNLEKKLRDRITTNMPTEEVMRKNPAGAVDWHQKWEKANKPLIRMWKNARIQLNPDNEDRDLCNIERYRPSGAVDRLRTDAQISGVMSYHRIPEELWPFDAPTNTAAEQAKRVYNENEAESEVNKAIEELDAEEARSLTSDAVEAEKEEISAERKAILVQRLAHAREVRKQQLAEQRKLDEQIAEIPEVQPV